MEHRSHTEKGYEHHHPQLNGIKGCRATRSLVQFRSLPYAQTPRRFARSGMVDRLPGATANGSSAYDATKYGPSSVQPRDSVETDIRWNQLPELPKREQDQDEDCLRLTMTCPIDNLNSGPGKIPVMVFLHGGALMIGSGERQYYDPVKLCTDAIESSNPVIFVSINYRLGALGFLHCPEASDYLPPNNGLYDQILAFEWIQDYIAGFGGDADNITAIGQSAGAASLSLHNSRSRSKPLYQKSIVLSGSTTVLVTMTPKQHSQEFLYQVEKLGIKAQGRSIEDIAIDIINAPIDAIRDLEYCGAPCSPSELIADSDWATMRHARHTTTNLWLESQILCSSTYDGSMSHLVAMGQDRTQLAKVFAAICRARLQNPQQLLEIYCISTDDTDEVALQKICQVVTDLGFYGAALSSLLGSAASTRTKSYHVLFDIGNPFTRLLEKGCFATHTWDVVSLLGAYDELLPEDCRSGVHQWRKAILAYCYSGELPCDIWRPDSQSLLVFRKDGFECLNHEQASLSKRTRLLRFAEQEGGESGYDLLWEDVIRFFLKTGNPRYSHEALDILKEHDRDRSGDLNGSAH
ncbi:MAG: hypothetical protein Q9168_005786 [Polycauliona sp. 1 TL-2023]